MEDMQDWERDEVAAIMECCGYDLQEAIDQKDNYCFFESVDAFYEAMDDLVDLSGLPEGLQCYFDYEAYHRDCMMDAYEAENGVVILQ